MQIPEPAKKGEVSFLGTMGLRHLEVQAAFAPVDRLVLQGSFFTWTRGSTGNRVSRSLGLGYVMPLGANQQLGFRAIYSGNEGFFDDKIYTDKSNNRFISYFNDYRYRTFGFQLDYTLKFKNFNFCFGSQFSRANYIRAFMRESSELYLYPNGPFLYNHERENFSTNFIQTSAGIQLKLSNFVSFYTCYTTTSIANPAINPTEGFRHSFDRFFISNSLIFTLRK
ncbi:MAG: hypothetical protein ACK4WD_04330 [Flavobacteriales bacterium]